MGVTAKIKGFFNKERLLIMAVVSVFYFNALRNGYSLDDSIVTEPANITAKGLSSIPKIFKSFYISSSEDYQFEYRPMVKLSFAIEHELFGVSPKTSHFFNIVLYIIGLFMLYKVLKLMFANHNHLIPFYAVLIFCALPIHTEVVTSIKNRDILLCFIFCMAGVRFYYDFFNSGFKKWLHLILCVMFLFFAFLSKFDVLPFFAIIPVIFYLKNPAKLKWLLLSIVFLFGAFVLYRLTRNNLVDAKGSSRLFYYFENPLYSDKSFVNKVTAGFNSLGFYMAQCIYPIKQCCYYGYNTIPVLKLGSYGYLGIIAFPLIIVGLIKSFLKKEYVIFTGIFMFIASISMYLNIVKPAVGIVADRYTFFASAGFSIAATGLLFKYFSEKNDLSKKVKMIGIVVLIIFGITVIKRNSDWKSISTILAADTGKYPDNAFLNYKTGIDIVKNLEKQSGQMSIEQRKSILLTARKHLEKSIEVEPNYANSRNYISYVLVYLLNDFNAALPHINHSIAYKETTELYFYKAIVMRETKHADSAEFYLNKCIKRDNDFYDAYSLLMFDYNLTKNYQKSIDMFYKALENGVKTEQIHLGLAKTFEEMGNKDEAIKNYREIVKINPQNKDAIAYLAKLEGVK